MTPAAKDALELELRQLSGVSFVGFGERDGRTVLELVTEPAVDRVVLADEVRRLAQSHLEGDVIVEMLDPPLRRIAGLRVQLLVVLRWPEQAEVEIHLAYRRRRAAAHAPAGEVTAAAAATLQALQALGFDVPFEVVSARLLPGEDNHGVVLTLASPNLGQVRRGVAAGRTIEEAGARATLHALNRFLEPLRSELSPA